MNDLFTISYYYVEIYVDMWVHDIHTRIDMTSNHKKEPRQRPDWCFIAYILSLLFLLLVLA